MISHRFAPVTVALLAFALVPTVIHSYRGLTVDDGLRVAAIPDVLAGAPSKPTDRRAQWVEARFEATDWFERTYRVGTDAVRVFAARSYDPKRLYHHPELAILRGFETVAGGVGRLPDRPDVPVHLLAISRDGRRGLAAYVLLYDGRYVEHPLLFQIRTGADLLFSGRKAMTLIMASDLRGSAASPEKAPSLSVLGAAIDAFEAAARARAAQPVRE